MYPQNIHTQLNHRGNTMGFPNQFRYNELPYNNMTHSKKEYINIPSQGPSSIRHSSYPQSSIIGNYQSMVPDVPFSTTYQNSLNNYINTSSIAAMGVALIIASNYK